MSQVDRKSIGRARRRTPRQIDEAQAIYERDQALRRLRAEQGLDAAVEAIVSDPRMGTVDVLSKDICPGNMHRRAMGWPVFDGSDCPTFGPEVQVAVL